MTGVPSQATRPHFGDGPWDRLLDELAHDDSILEQTVRRIRATVPGYDDVPTEALQASVRRNLALSIRTIRTGAQPRPEDVDEADSLAAERHAQGVPIGSMLAGFRICMSGILDKLVHRAPLAGIPTDQVLDSSILLWSLGDAFSSRAGVVYQEREVSRMLADSSRRTEWIGNVVATQMDPAELLRGAALYNVPTTEPVCAVVVNSTAEQSRQRLHRWADSTGTELLTAVRAGSLVGIMLGTPVPSVQPKGITVGIGHLVTLESLPKSFEAASLALKGAECTGQTGAVDVERLSWRLAVHTTPEVTSMLCEQYLQPLEDQGAFGENMLEAVQAYLRHRMNIPAAAQSIPVHVNTLRYRLERFRALVGADLGDVDTLVELSWALAARAGTGNNHPPHS
ncbi:PucR family transcriptional regulator [Nesterenkonia muleiensis]|uniref:PucR family transcriptional regulator n=1 Tax=Nesterenkonia muleiensis TaxID=2282648 RepID=UPI000E74A183|nr:helix-turn-helix domain-containing protein [Nesterenkonia muleiensis]